MIHGVLGEGVLLGCAETAGHPSTRQPAWDEYSCGGGSVQMPLQSEEVTVVQEMIDSTSPLSMRTRPSGDCRECFKLDCFIRYLGT